MEQINNEKVLAMFRAVCDLIDEGMEIDKIKVSDVTQKAGIGKGTAYEYFRSKEELLFQALHYDFLQQFQTFHSKLQGTSSFYEAVMSGFDWMEEHACNNRMKVQFLNLTQMRKKLDRNDVCARANAVFDENVWKDSLSMNAFHDILDSLIIRGVEEKIINESISKEMLKLDIVSRFVEYFIYIKMRSSDRKTDIENMRKFLYEGMMKQYAARL